MIIKELPEEPIFRKDIVVCPACGEFICWTKDISVKCEEIEQCPCCAQKIKWPVFKEKDDPYNPYVEKLFLLSEDDYFSVERNIKKYCSFSKSGLNNATWLRSKSSNYSQFVAGVRGDGECVDIKVDTAQAGVAPAFLEETEVKVGTIQVKYNFPFVYVGECLWVSESYIFWSRFDEKSNDYEHSEIRKKILEWAEERGK